MFAEYIPVLLARSPPERLGVRGEPELSGAAAVLRVCLWGFGASGPPVTHTPLTFLGLLQKGSDHYPPVASFSFPHPHFLPPASREAGPS